MLYNMRSRYQSGSSRFFSNPDVNLINLAVITEISFLFFTGVIT
jgi:hypothetical protein